MIENILMLLLKQVIWDHNLIWEDYLLHYFYQMKCLGQNVFGKKTWKFLSGDILQKQRLLLQINVSYYNFFRLSIFLSILI